MKILRELLDLGQSIWFDNISRGIIKREELGAMVNEGVTGVTSNPTIFEKSISGSGDYDAQIEELLGSSQVPDASRLIQELMIRDIRDAADVLRPVYDRSGGHDGFVSVEVTPTKARNTAGTIDEVRYLWKRIDRPNLMVKIPATLEGLPAIKQMLYEGININITLIFSVERYGAVADAYCSAMTQRLRKKKPLDNVASVASVFVSRVDTLVDGVLQKRIDRGEPKLVSLLGTAAVANAKIIYKKFREIFTSPRFAELAAHGAQVQRPLWGSTGTKNPAYDDLKYVNTLIGEHTVNTVPPQTYKAILDHGTAALTIEKDVDGAIQALAELKSAGIDMDRMLLQLEEEGVAAFEQSFDGLLRYLNARHTSLAPAVH